MRLLQFSLFQRLTRLSGSKSFMIIREYLFERTRRISSRLSDSSNINNMEDLSSLEGPPIQDGRFTPVSFPMSPVSPENTYIAYNPLRDAPQGSVSPLTSAARSVYASSISSIPVRLTQNMDFIPTDQLTRAQIKSHPYATHEVTPPSVTQQTSHPAQQAQTTPPLPTPAHPSGS